jgi:hypothetical protein
MSTKWVTENPFLDDKYWNYVRTTYFDENSKWLKKIQQFRSQFPKIPKFVLPGTVHHINRPKLSPKRKVRKLFKKFGVHILRSEERIPMNSDSSNFPEFGKLGTSTD